MRPTRLLTIAISALAATPLAAQVSCDLVRDIATASTPNSSVPMASRGGGNVFAGGYVALGSARLFTATDSAHGRELWRTDGTASGTQLLRDIRPGSRDGAPTQLTRCGSFVFFTADDGTRGTELWRTDGTAAGTTVVRDIRPGSASSAPSDFACLGNTVYFAATDAANDRELWRSDGTSGGTVRVKNIYPGSASSAPRHLRVFGSTLLFQACDGVRGTELWRSDGTSSGTQLLRDLYSGSRSSNPDQFCPLGGRAVFRATDGAGTELWVTDGSSGGTRRLRDIYSGSDSSLLSLFYSDAILGNSLLFTARTSSAGLELWKTDGTASGTQLVRDVRSGSASSAPTALVRIGTRVFFLADSSSGQLELWTTDASNSGTRRVRVIGAGIASRTACAEFAGRYYFALRNLNRGAELWSSNGTFSGTVRVTGSIGVDEAQDFTEMPSGRLLYGGPSPSQGTELMAIDASTGRAALVRDLYPGSSTPASSPSALTCSLDGLNGYFSATGPAGAELWKVTRSSCVQVKDIRPGSQGSFPTEITSCWLGNRELTFFAADDGTNGNELWVTDGSPGGTRMLRDIFSGNQSSYPRHLVCHNGELFFRATSSAGSELWKSDGTAGGTTLVNDIDPGNGRSSLPRSLVSIGPTLYFVASSATRGPELWRSDGTANGTVLVRDIRPGSVGSFPAELTRCGDRLMFTADNGAFGRELWISDGTTSGTQMVRDVFPGSPGSAPSSLTCCDDILYFAANSNTTGTELWRSNGTSIGTRLVRDLLPGSGSSAPANLACCDGTLFFSAIGAGIGRELWKSDGTSAGTSLVRDIEPGPGSSSPTNLHCIGTGIYFRASGLIASTRHGAELWFSDGTSSGTRLVCDLRTGDASSHATNITACFGALYVAADDGVRGMELHVVRDPGASVRTLGQGSGTAFSTLTSTQPILGQSATHRVAGGPAGQIGYLLLSLPSGPFTIPGLFEGNASAFLDLPSLTVVATVAAPMGSVALPIPNSATLNGKTIHTQACWIHPTQLATIEFTNGLELNLGR